MEVPPTVWADLPHIVLCFVALVFCKKLWKWIQRIQINVDKPKHQVGLPELVTNLVSMPETAKPEEENEKYVDVLEQSEVTRPKILTVSNRETQKWTLHRKQLECSRSQMSGIPRQPNQHIWKIRWQPHHMH